MRGPESKFKKNISQRFDAYKAVFVKRDEGVYVIDLWKETCKSVLKQDFAPNGKIDYLSEFGPGTSLCFDFNPLP
jgi:hypothetical protein